MKNYKVYVVLDGEKLHLKHEKMNYDDAIKLAESFDDKKLTWFELDNGDVYVLSQYQQERAYLLIKAV